jgi:hypothetical protein
MGATHFGRFVLVGGCAFVVCRGMAALEAFLVGEDEVTQNDGGLLLRSQGRWRAGRGLEWAQSPWWRA